MVGDDGIGMDTSMDFSNPGTIGLRIVKLLVEHQLEGTMAFTRSNGTRFTIQFKTSTHRSQVAP